VTRFLRLFTTLPLDEIARVGALQGQEINEAKKVLATEATAMLHGREAAEKAADTARTTFEEGALSRACRRSRCARRTGSRARRALGIRRQDRSRCLEWRSAPSDQGRRAQGQRRLGRPTEKMTLTLKD